MPEQKETPAAAWLILSLAVIAVSSAGIVLQEMSNVKPLLRASWRMQGTAMVLLPGFLWQLKRLEKPSLSMNDWLLIMASSVFLAIHFGSWVWSLDNTSLVHSLLFVNMHPLIVVALMPMMGEVVRRGHLEGVIVGIAGAMVALMDLGDGGEVTLMGDFAAFLGAVTIVGYILVGRELRSNRDMPIFVYAFPVTMGAGIWLSIGTLLFEGSTTTTLQPESSILGWTDPIWIVWVGYLSIGPGLCGHTGFNTVLRWIPPIIVSISMLLEPVIGALIGYMWTGDALIGLPTVVGGLMMMAGAMHVTLQGKSESVGESVS